jgi:hypothetical protein
LPSCTKNSNFNNSSSCTILRDNSIDSANLPVIINKKNKKKIKLKPLIPPTIHSNDNSNVDPSNKPSTQTTLNNTLDLHNGGPS